MNHYERLHAILAGLEHHAKSLVDKRQDEPFMAILDAILEATRKLALLPNAVALEVLRRIGKPIHEVLSSPAVIDLVNAMSLALGVSTLTATKHAIFLLRSSSYMINYEKAGKKCYRVCDGLAQQLIHTELRGLKGKDLRLPFESILIEIPKILGFQIWNRISGWHDAESVYVEEAVVHGVRRWYLMWTAFPKEKGETPTDVADDAIAYLGIDILDDEDLGTILQKTTEKCSEDHILNDTYPPNESCEDRRKFWEPLLRWVVNVAFYSTYPRAEVEKLVTNKEYRQLQERIRKLPQGKKKEELKKRLKTIDPRERYVLGRNVVYVDKTTAEKMESERAAKAGTKPTLVVLVSGHWKHQPCGPQHSLRKLIFIEPYWRNLEGTILGTNVHVLK